MIKIDRNRVKAPQRLLSEASLKFKQAKVFFKRAVVDRHQQRFDFSLVPIERELRPSLALLFHDKCAYCETPLHPKNSVIERHRPTQGATGTTDKAHADHYWWLAWDWKNLYLCCTECARAKANRFPVQAARLAVGSKTLTEQGVEERPWLLDPCRDAPERHLSFDADGYVSGLTQRGKIAIETLVLNRAALVRARKQAAASFLAQLRTPGPEHELAIAAANSPATPFCGLLRQLLKAPRQGPKADAKDASARSSQRRHEQGHALRSIDAGSERARKIRRLRTRYIKRVTLQNVGIHKHLTFEIKSEGTSNAPWTVVLGENGVGKSTLLKAIGFTLAGHSSWDLLGEHAEAILPADGKTAAIKLELFDGSVLQLRIHRKTQRLTGNAVRARLPVLGFGATRLPPNARHPSPQESSSARLTNLFDPYSPLGEAEKWLRQLGPDAFEHVGATLRALLSLEGEERFVSTPGSISLRLGKVLTPIRHLSDGYQSIIGVACDIMAILLDPDLPPEHAEGIVLIDEIGNHLHPTWRMRIVDNLRRAFPRVQFIATTHEPLCLRGLDEGEIVVLRRGASGIDSLQDLPPVSGLLVDQILSSQHFGLRNTLEPQIADQFDDYYALLAKERRTQEEQSRLDVLEAEISKIRVVGETPREQILLKAIDTFIATKERQLVPIDPASLPPAFLKELAEMMGEGAEETEGAP